MSIEQVTRSFSAMNLYQTGAKAMTAAQWAEIERKIQEIGESIIQVRHAITVDDQPESRTGIALRNQLDKARRELTLAERMAYDANWAKVSEEKEEQQDKDLAAKGNEIIAESYLVHSGTVNLWSPGRIKKYLRKYSLGPGTLNFYSQAKNRYYLRDVWKARQEMLEAEPRNPDGRYKNSSLAFLQGENSLA